MSNSINNAITINNEAPVEVEVLFSMDNHIPTPVTVNANELSDWASLQAIMEANGISYSSDLKYRFVTFDSDGEIDTVDVDLNNVNAPLYQRGGTLRNVNVYGTTTKQGNGADMDLASLNEEAIQNLNRTELYRVVKQLKRNHNIDFDALTGENHTRTTSKDIKAFLNIHIPALASTQAEEDAPEPEQESPSLITLEDVPSDRPVFRNPEDLLLTDDNPVKVDVITVETPQAPRPSGIAPGGELPMLPDTLPTTELDRLFHNILSGNLQNHDQVVALREELSDLKHQMNVKLSDISTNLSIIREKLS